MHVFNNFGTCCLFKVQFLSKELFFADRKPAWSAKIDSTRLDFNSPIQVYPLGLADPSMPSGSRWPKYSLWDSLTQVRQLGLAGSTWDSLNFAHYPQLPHSAQLFLLYSVLLALLHFSRCGEGSRNARCGRKDTALRVHCSWLCGLVTTVRRSAAILSAAAFSLECERQSAIASSTGFGRSLRNHLGWSFYGEGKIS